MHRCSVLTLHCDGGVFSSDDGAGGREGADGREGTDVDGGPAHIVSSVRGEHWHEPQGTAGHLASDLCPPSHWVASGVSNGAIRS